MIDLLRCSTIKLSNFCERMIDTIEVGCTVESKYQANSSLLSVTSTCN